MNCWAFPGVKQPVQLELGLELRRFFCLWHPGDMPEGKLLARFGDVLYWVCCALALFVIFWGARSEFGGHDADGPYVFSVAVVAGFAIWIVGRACRYILSGK